MLEDYPEEYREELDFMNKYTQSKVLMSTSMEKVQVSLNTMLELTEKNMKDKKDLYSDWIAEEYKEFMAEEDGTPEQFKELCDLIWVCIQKANKQGYDLRKGMVALIDEYCSKFYNADHEYEPIYHPSGKLKKNTGFKKANFKALME